MHLQIVAFVDFFESLRIARFGDPSKSGDKGQAVRGREQLVEALSENVARGQLQECLRHRIRVRKAPVAIEREKAVRRAFEKIGDFALRRNALLVFLVLFRQIEGNAVESNRPALFVANDPRNGAHALDRLHVSRTDRAVLHVVGDALAKGAVDGSAHFRAIFRMHVPKKVFDVDALVRRHPMMLFRTHVPVELVER